MLNKFFFYTVLLIVVFPGISLAQKTWTLEDCINHAMKNNLQIKQAENNLEISDQNLLQNRGAQLPTINGTGTHNYNFGRNIDPFTNQFTNSQVQSNNFSLSTSLLLFNGLQVRNSIQQSRYDFLTTSYQLATLKNDISLNISAAYLDILFNKELVVNATNQLNLTKQQYDRSKKLVEAGSLAPTSLYDLEAQMASEEATLTRTQNNLTLSYLNLTQYLDLPASEPFEIVQPETISVTPDNATNYPVDEVVKNAIENQPQIKSNEYRRLSSLQALQIARGRQSPRLSLNASLSTLYSSSSKIVTGQGTPYTQLIGYTQNTTDPVYTIITPNIFGYKPYGAQLRDNYNRFVGLTLTIPILNGLQVRTSISRAKLAVNNAELDLRISKMTVEKTVRKAYTDKEIALSNFRAADRSVKASSDALNNAEKRLGVGLMNSFEYSQTKNRLTNAQSELLRAKYDFIFKQKVLDFYNGIPLKL